MAATDKHPPGRGQLPDMPPTITRGILDSSSYPVHEYE